MESKEPSRNEDFFSWEASYSKIWSVILEDESESIGNSISKLNALQQKRLVRSAGHLPGLKKGLVRNLILVLDASKSSNVSDLYPYRLKWGLNKVGAFAKEYFEENPLCQLGLVLTRDGLADRVCNLTSKLLH